MIELVGIFGSLFSRLWDKNKNILWPLGSTFVIWNVIKLKYFEPSKELRQGDPLSPYIFVQCIEVSSQMIKGSVELGEQKSIKASYKGPRISHVFFANDLILLGGKSRAGQNYENNPEKFLSKMFTSKNTCKALPQISVDNLGFR